MTETHESIPKTIFKRAICLRSMRKEMDKEEEKESGESGNKKKSNLRTLPPCAATS